MMKFRIVLGVFSNFKNFRNFDSELHSLFYKKIFYKNTRLQIGEIRLMQRLKITTLCFYTLRAIFDFFFGLGKYS